MKMFAMCRNCGRSLAGSGGLCRVCVLHDIPNKRIQQKPPKKLR